MNYHRTHAAWLSKLRALPLTDDTGDDCAPFSGNAIGTSLACGIGAALAVFALGSWLPGLLLGWGG